VDPQIVCYSERPELWDALGDLFDGVWPEYNELVGAGQPSLGAMIRGS
jgi:hypothetical protein